MQTSKSFALFPVQTSRRYETELTALQEERKELSKALNSYQLGKSCKELQATILSELQLVALPAPREILQKFREFFWTVSLKSRCLNSQYHKLFFRSKEIHFEAPLGFCPILSTLLMIKPACNNSWKPL